MGWFPDRRLVSTGVELSAYQRRDAFEDNGKAIWFLNQLLRGYRRFVAVEDDVASRENSRVGPFHVVGLSASILRASTDGGWSWPQQLSLAPSLPGFFASLALWFE